MPKEKEKSIFQEKLRKIKMIIKNLRIMKNRNSCLKRNKIHAWKTLVCNGDNDKDLYLFFSHNLGYFSKISFIYLI